MYMYRIYASFCLFRVGLGLKVPPECKIAVLTAIQGTGYPNSTMALICSLEWKPGANTTIGL